MNPHFTIGNSLSRFLNTRDIPYARRDIYTHLSAFLARKYPHRICLLYGLRHTGKTTLMCQAVQELEQSGIKCAYTDILKTPFTMDELFNALDDLRSQNIRHVFIDEAPLLHELFINGAGLANIYAKYGMRIVMAGDDSLAFYLHVASGRPCGPGTPFPG